MRNRGLIDSSLMSVRCLIEFIKFFLSDRRRDIYSFVTINLLIICLSISPAVLFCVPIDYVVTLYFAISKKDFVGLFVIKKTLRILK